MREHTRIQGVNRRDDARREEARRCDKRREEKRRGEHTRDEKSIDGEPSAHDASFGSAVGSSCALARAEAAPREPCDVGDGGIAAAAPPPQPTARALVLSSLLLHRRPPRERSRSRLGCSRGCRRGRHLRGSPAEHLSHRACRVGGPRRRDGNVSRVPPPAARRPRPPTPTPSTKKVHQEAPPQK